MKQKSFNSYWSRVWVQEFWYIFSGLDIQPEQSKNDNPARKKLVPSYGCEIQQVIFQEINLNLWLSGLEEKQWLPVSRATWVQFLQGAENLCSSSAILRGTEADWAHQCTDTRAFILMHSLLFFFLGFRQWRSCAGKVLTLNMNIWLQLFWSTWSRPRARTRPYVQAFHVCDYSYCRLNVEPRSKSDKRCLALERCLALGFPWIVENTWK